jgi:hypothetical protein
VTKIWPSVLGGLRGIGKGVEKGRLVSLRNGGNVVGWLVEGE